jgi:RNA polymerase sigma-70 factor (ECF subfamily)
MVGSSFDAEDAVQETMLRAWRAAEGFEGRSSVRSWLHRIATNVCLDMLRGRKRRALPMDMGPSLPPVVASLEEVLADGVWVTPIPDALVLGDCADPAELAATRDSVRLAFVAALQHLPARQRVALILCEVLRRRAAEVAELLDTSVAAVNSALQRLRCVRPVQVRPGGRARRLGPAGDRGIGRPDQRDPLVPGAGEAIGVLWPAPPPAC